MPLTAGSRKADTMGMLRAAVGPAFIALSFALMTLRVEPFASFFYLFSWYGLIFTFDQLVLRREGRSAVARCGTGFILVLLWSAGSWYFFELVNLRLENWYYVFVTRVSWLRVGGDFLSFGTVFPGILLLDHYLALGGVGARLKGRRIALSVSGRHTMQVLGALFLVLPLLFPKYCFPLIWIAVILLLAPLEYRPGGDGLLNQLEAGVYGPLVRTLLAGLIAGLFWELFNFWARAKWIYTVPFFSELKLFEMPVAGFLGFPPFALECVIAYRLLVWHRLAPPFAGVVLQRPEPRRGASRGMILAAVAVFSLAVDQWVVGPHIITSVTPSTPQAVGLSPAMRKALLEAGARNLTDLEGWYGKRLWRDLAHRLTPEQIAEVRRITAVYLHQGIGIEYGNLLMKIGVRSLCDLAAEVPEELHSRLRAHAGTARVPTLRQVRVWVSRARCASGSDQPSAETRRKSSLTCSRALARSR